MKSVIFYIGRKYTGREHPIASSDGTVFYIRTQTVTGDLLEALDKAKPRAYEAVMNTHPLVGRLGS